MRCLVNRRKRAYHREVHACTRDGLSPCVRFAIETRKLMEEQHEIFARARLLKALNRGFKAPHPGNELGVRHGFLAYLRLKRILAAYSQCFGKS